MAEDPRQYLNDNEEGMRLAFEGQQSDIWTAMPGIVQSVNLTAMTCVVQLAIQGRYQGQDGSNQYINIAPLQDCPICFPSAGGFTITLPIKAGDEVLVIFASRCIDAWWQSGGYLNQALEIRMHDLSDGFVIPGPRSQKRLVAAISSTDLQIRNDAGTTYISITADGKIKLVSASEIDITGNLKVTGAITATGEVTAGFGTSNIDLTGHKHTGVTTGGGTSGGPVP